MLNLKELESVIEKEIDAVRETIASIMKSERTTVLLNIKEAGLHHVLFENQRNVLQTISDYIEDKIFPVIFIEETLKAARYSEEFGRSPFTNLISNLKYQRYFPVRVTAELDEYSRLRFEIDFDESYFDLNIYSNAVTYARQLFSNADEDILDPIKASWIWSRIYRAGRRNQKIIDVYRTKKGKLRAVDVTERYKKYYNRTIRARVSAMPSNSLPFFEILDKGTGLPMPSNRGGIPTPTYKGYGIIMNVTRRLYQLEVEFVHYFNELFNQIVSIQIDVPDNITKEEAFNQLVESLLEKGVIDKEAINILSTNESELINLVSEYLRSIGIHGVKVKINQTKTGAYTLVVRDSKGHFVRWRMK
jgi:hypothetical protein